MRLVRPPVAARWIYPHAIFRKGEDRKQLCLTFDDGPDKDSTPRILDILAANSVHAIFFCRGDAAEKYPGLVRRIVAGGHLVGNHSHSHPNGWTTTARSYLEDVRRADRFTSPVLFRPPYGRMRPSQYIKLRERYIIVMWDLMPFDYDQALEPGRILRILKEGIRPGSVIALHDKPTASSAGILDEFILFARNKGYHFSVDGFC